MAALAWALLAFDLPMPKWSAQIIGGRRASFGTPDPWPRLLASGYWASAVNTNDNDQGLAVSWLTHEDMHKKPTTTLNIKHPCPITAEIDQNCLKASQPLPFECLAMQHNHLPAETAINWNCESVCVCKFLGWGHKCQMQWLIKTYWLQELQKNQSKKDSTPGQLHPLGSFRPQAGATRQLRDPRTCRKTNHIIHQSNILPTPKPRQCKGNILQHDWTWTKET